MVSTLSWRNWYASIDWSSSPEGWARLRPWWISLVLLVSQPAALAAQAPPAAQTPALASTSMTCEVHVWPTRNGLANIQGLTSLVTLLGFVVDQAVHQQANRQIGAAIIEKIPPDAQVAALAANGVKEALHMPADARIVAEATLPAYSELSADIATKQKIDDMGRALKSGARLISSEAPCYAELLVSAVGYARSPVDQPVLAGRWIYRIWRNGEVTNVTGWRRKALPATAATNTGVRELPDAVMQELYSAALINWAHKKLKS